MSLFVVNELVNAVTVPNLIEIGRVCQSYVDDSVLGLNSIKVLISRAVADLSRGQLCTSL